MRVFAHRGYSGAYPENTMLSFQKAVEVGTDGIELDVRLSEDGKVVVFHDDDLARLTGDRSKVREVPLAQLQRMRLAGVPTAHIPTLREVLALVDGRVPLLIEIKNYKAANVGRLESLLKERLERYEGEVILESFRTLYGLVCVPSPSLLADALK